MCPSAHRSDNVDRGNTLPRPNEREDPSRTIEHNRWICAHDAQRVSHSLFLCCFNSNRINYFDMLVSFRRRLVHPSLCASCLCKSMLYTVPCDIGAIILFSFLYMYIYIFLGPLVGRRSSLFRSNSPFRFPLITYGSYINPFELLLSSAFISR